MKKNFPAELQAAISKHEEKWGEEKPEWWSSKWEADCCKLREVMQTVRDRGEISNETYRALSKQYFGNMMCTYVGELTDDNLDLAYDALRWLFSPEVAAELEGSEQE